MSRHYKCKLNESTPDNSPKKFDMVSHDAKIIGDAKYLTLVKEKFTPLAKFMVIAGHVWILKELNAKHRFLVFGNQRAVPERWLQRYGHLVKGVSFFFLSNRGKLEKLTRASSLRSKSA
ncbi:MAG: hypothetical protein WCG52_08500 [bacterium]